MGGSSLCPDVLAKTFGHRDHYPEILVLDSTDPAQVRRFEGAIDCSRALFIVSSKSGTTLEPAILYELFFDRAWRALGRTAAAARFVAITDPGSELHRLAAREGFGHVFAGVPSIGGRYSALSVFGLVPAAIMGIDVEELLSRAQQMSRASGPESLESNPGLILGLALGLAARAGRDKVTFVASPALASFGAWLEQLLAESTGKAGRGLMPVDGEAVGRLDVYGQDRIFVQVRLAAVPDPGHDAAMKQLAASGHPVICVTVRDIYDLGQELFRWEFATAVAGSVLGINPFDQPDVEATKIATRALMAQYEGTRALPTEAPVAGEGELECYADEANRAALERSAGSPATVADLLAAHIARLSPGDYFAILAFVDMHERHDFELQRIRHAVRDRKRVATSLGYGPRFLHSTGQAHKGGPASGVLLQVTCDHATDVAVPGRPYSFGVVEAAQARGDFQVLAARSRRLLRVHLKGDPVRALTRLYALVERVTRPGHPN